MNITDDLFHKAKKLAKEMQDNISHDREKSEQEFHEIMMRMLQDPLNKVFLLELLDQSFRSKNNSRIADQLEYIFDKYGSTSFFTDFEKILIMLFRNFGVYLPAISVPLFVKYLREDISDIVIKGEDASLSRHLRKRKKEGTRVNINIIGEAVLGEDEANERVKKYAHALENPDIDYISIKISTIFSQISPLAHNWSVDKISEKIEHIYDAAMQNRFTDKDSKQHHKFVNLDMEEYKDINLTIDTFINTLSKEKYKSLYAGIVLQTYIPDTLQHAKRLVEWAKKRVEDGGSPIKIRLVKGANQEMEKNEASLRGWPCVTYDEKKETDANYKLLMDYLLSEESAPYAHVGIASHNLFDHALALLIAKERGLENYYSAEMLEGMSETAYKLLKGLNVNVILYAPTATLHTFTNAIAYLVRRFDENTAPENFLRHSFGLEVDTPAWKELVQRDNNSILSIPHIALKPFRVQDRNNELTDEKIDLKTYTFKNEPDTDFALPQNIKWAESIALKFKDTTYKAYPVIGGETIESAESVDVIDKSQYHDKVLVGSYVKASRDDIQRAIKTAKDDVDGWRDLSLDERQKILMDVAIEFKKDRGDLIGIAAAEVGKVFTETDVEVSEAIDFLNFYPYSVKKTSEIDGLSLKGKGVGLVVSPWNFPIAIPAGGIAAALASGNTAILKPASDSVLSAYRLCECFWRAGVSKNTLQFIPVDGAVAGETLIASKDIDFTIFTGSERTAYDMIKTRPDIHLSAETGGKDATIVTSLADRDQAVKNVVASAFNNSGQKCSATSLLVLEKELYEDEHFKEMLKDAASSLEVGSVWDFKNRIGTLSSLPSGNLSKALEYLDDGEEWLLKPSYEDNNPYMLKPSIRWGTKKGDFCHTHELFGPVLSVVCAENLEDAIEIVNSTGYGLTSGLESLDEREQQIFKEKIVAGNLYINRVTTGAIVTRQPFGGMKKSAIGSGKKAGGFNYVSQFMDIQSSSLDNTKLLYHPEAEKFNKLYEHKESFSDDIMKAMMSVKNFSYWLNEEFDKEHDYCNIRGEDNNVRYLPLKNILLRIGGDDSFHQIISSIFAAKMLNIELYLSVESNTKNQAVSWLIDNNQLLLEKNDILSIEDENHLISIMHKFERMRVLNKENISGKLYESLGDTRIYIASEPFVDNGRIELMHYLREQSVSNSYHRYGNLGIRSLETK